jgi:TRAP-type mannitol/chloroaromatic compound transport system substrate-binding protein
MTIGRRGLLKGGAIGAVVAASSFPKPAISQGLRRWKMVTCWPKNFPGLGMAANDIGNEITTMSEGRLEVKVYGAGEIVPAFEVFDAVRGGVAEMGHAADLYWLAKHPGFAFTGGVPNGLSGHEQIAWLLHGGGREMWDELYGGFGMRVFLAGVAPPSLFGWYREPINSLADFKGLKIRQAGLPGEVVSRMGATGINLPAGEIMPALQSGVIDAAEWGGPWTDLAFGFYKVTRYAYGPGIHEPGAVNGLMVNGEAFDDLPGDLREMVQVTAHKAALRVFTEVSAHNITSYEVLKNEHGVTFARLPDDVLAAFIEHADAVVQETAAKDPLAQRLHDSMAAYRARSHTMADFSERGFLGARKV